MSTFNWLLHPLVVTIIVGVAATSAHAATVDFNRDVLPILSDRCFACHGPDLNALEADLSLIDLTHATADRDGDGPAIIPGDAANSLVYERIIDADDPMPPEKSEIKPLTAEEAEIIRLWIDSGAEYEDHWAFVPVKQPEIPQVADPEWNHHPIDRFIAAKLDEKNIQPATHLADRALLARRAALVLTGLTPSLEELDTYLADTSPSAYEHFVDQQLAKPSFGEHQARYWFDAMRFADTSGRQTDHRRAVWPYRDWVIRALNNNMPLDDFIRWQLAGDLIEDATLEQYLATGFLRLNNTTDEGGVIDEEVRADNGFDRVETFGTMFLGMTMSCARCHDHKYDPIPTADYYSMMAFLNSTAETPRDGKRYDYPPSALVPSNDADWRAFRQFEREEQAYYDSVTVDDQQISQWANSQEMVPLINWRRLGPIPFTSAEEAFENNTGAEDGISTVDDLTWQSVALKEIEKKPVGKVKHLAYIAVDVEVANTSIEEWTVRSGGSLQVFINGAEIFNRQNIPGIKPSSFSITLSPGSHRVVFKVLTKNRKKETFSLKRSDPTIDTVKKKGLQALSAIDKKRLVVHRYLPDFETDPERSDALHSWVQKYSQLETRFSPSMIALEDPNPPQVHILFRGDYTQPREAVERVTNANMGAWPDGAKRNRLGLAEWLLSEDQPLMTRVWVNRMWQRVFGRGLVGTPEDFGLQGERPTHPLLLDWLASELRRSGWDFKHMLKLMVMSRAFRQSSMLSDGLRGGDPENKYLARGPWFRLDGEVIRDQALAISGLLNSEGGGQGVKPYQPYGLWQATSVGRSDTKKYVQDHGDALYRRSVYLFWKRASPPPVMSLFDAPDRQISCVSRSRTRTPLQSLALLNETANVEAARHLAQRALEHGSTNDQERAQYLYRLATCREPSAAELKVCLQLVATGRQRYATDSEAAVQLLATGESPRNESLNPNEHAAWLLLASVILSSDRCLNLY